MNAIVKFSQKDFRRGVDDTLSLAPLRKAAQEFASKHVGGMSTPRPKRSENTQVDVKKATTRSR